MSEKGRIMNFGFRIKRDWSRVDSSLAEAYRDLPAANVSDVMNRMPGLGHRLRPMHQAGGLVGPALTVRGRPGDNLMLHKAIDLAQPGDVIVHDGGGDLTNALIGELMVAHAKQRGVAGIVIYGAVRDSAALWEIGLPVYALGVTHKGPYRDGPGEIGFAIGIEGSIIEPGDLVIGDRDGVLAVPRVMATDILNLARGKSEAEHAQLEKTIAGTLDRGWVDELLERNGCIVLD